MINKNRKAKVLLNLAGWISLIGLTVLAILFAPSCQNPFSPLEDLGSIPETTTINGVRLSLQVLLYRDFMPGLDENGSGSGLIAMVTLIADNAAVFPDYITADRIYVLKGEETWETSLKEELRPVSPAEPNKICLVARDGPKWELGSQAEVVVRISAKDLGYKFIRASNQTISPIY
ncbi:MAG: hypothetical protein WC524_04990 [Candidatus Aminicenantales bacterium]|nr:hypothetical protein [Acidobacteriota bacterium]